MSKSSPDSTKETKLELEKLQQKVTAANQHLIHLENEVRAVQKRRQTLKDEVDLETNRLVAERKLQLAATDDAHNERIRELGKTISELTNEVIAIKRRKLELESENEALQTDNALLGDRRANLLKQLTEETADLETAQRKYAQIQAQIQHLQGTIAPLQDKQLQLEGVIASLEANRDELEAKTATLDNAYNSKIAKIDNEIASVLEKKQQLELVYAETVRQHEMMSEEIASRVKAADEREANLKRREMKVAQDERMVARNAGLLKL